MTIIISVAFGGLTEVVSKYLYVWKPSGFKDERLKQKVKVSTLVIDDETDEELEEKYANIEVNFDESETEEEEFVSEKYTDIHKIDVTEEEIVGEQSVEYNEGFDNVYYDNSNNENYKDHFDESDLYDDDIFLGDTAYTGDIPVSRGKSFIQDPFLETDMKKELGKV